jgi:hypothetical protein
MSFYDKTTTYLTLVDRDVRLSVWNTKQYIPWLQQRSIELEKIRADVDAGVLKLQIDEDKSDFKWFEEERVGVKKELRNWANEKECFLPTEPSSLFWLRIYKHQTEKKEKEEPIALTPSSNANCC